MKIAYGIYTSAVKPMYSLWESQKEKKGTEILFKEIMAEYFSNLRRKIYIKIHES